MKRSIQVAVIACIAAGVAVLGYGLTGHSPSSGTGSSRFSSPVSGSGSNAPPEIATDAARRVADILTSMHLHAFNVGAPPSKGAGSQPGGLYINWSGTWDGDPSTAADNTDFGSDGQTDSEAGRSARHDEFTDLLYLRNLYGYRAAHPGDSTFNDDITRIASIVRNEFASYTYYKCSLYGELRAMDTLDPNDGWGPMADTYAEAVLSRYYDAAAGLVHEPGKQSLRVDYAIECADAFVDDGNRRHDQAMQDAGRSTADALLRLAQNPSTHLFPLQISLDGAVTQAQVKVGDEAQILDTLLDLHTLTGDAGFLTVAHEAVTSMYTSGLYDTTNGGFFFSIDADGTNLQSGYKETRQAWMLRVLERLDAAEPGQWHDKYLAMRNIVIEQLWQPGSDGMLYRLTANFKPYQSNEGPGHSPVTEDWVTTEAMDIAAEVLES